MITICLLVVGIASLNVADAPAPINAADSCWNVDSHKPQPDSATQATESLDAIYLDLVSSRTLQLARLHAYAAAGQFPQNTDFPGRLVPYFVDHAGTACAVGHLMRLDGQTPLVNHIAASCNHIRIEDVSRGPLVDWIHDSGLTHAECALIQPSYATIEDYRRGREWRDEQTRLRDHFARVEKTLRVQSQRSLGEALIAKLEADRHQRPESATNNVAALTVALDSPERNVRIAAAHLLASIPPETTLRGPRIEALRLNLRDPDLAVRFWTAVAIEQIGAAKRWGELPSPGNVELHLLTLPVFLDVLHSDFDDLRLPALVQLANIAPESIGTNMQLRIVPETRHAIVDACRDRDSDVRTCARQILTAWRWQRTAYESQRMRRHYLADSFELESLAAETLVLGRSFATPSPAVAKLRHQESQFDDPGGISIFESRPAAKSPPIAANRDAAAKTVDENLRIGYANQLKEGNQPLWSIDSVIADDDDLYFTVKVVYPGTRYTHSTTYLVPRPTMFSVATVPPHSWLETIHGTSESIWPTTPPSVVRPAPNLQIQLGNAARNDLKTFTNTCDLCASFLTFYARVVMDREVLESADSLTWSGRIGDLRQYRPRFLEQGGGGSSVYGGGGWDFHRLTMTCNRTSGNVTLEVEPIAYTLKQLPQAIIAPDWTTEELKLMGWKPLRSPDFFGERLLPREYHEVAQEFDPSADKNAREKTRVKLYRTWAQDKSLPSPSLINALLYDRAGDRETAIQSIKYMNSDILRDPAALADVARWELSVGETAAARKHAEAALKLWPNHPAAKAVINQLAAADSVSE